MLKYSISVTFLFFTLIILSPLTFADTYLKPFILASTTTGAIEEQLVAVKEKLKQGGFELVGEYSPYENAHILVVTSPTIKQAASSSEHGGYAAAMRVAITKRGENIQISYNNPVYLANAYRLSKDMSDVAQAFKKALGFEKEYGSEKGLTAKQLRKYHYMFGMEYFDDPSELGEFASHKQAVQAVENGLAARKGGVSKVYRIDIPGKDEVLFGVHMTRECSADKFIMGHFDFKDIRSTAHLPYEMLVSGDTVYALYARFRIAIDFPDLKMMGDNSFMKIMCAPGEIEDALEAVVK